MKFWKKIVTASGYGLIPRLERENDRMREALNTIISNTEPSAFKHRDYDHLAKDICDCATAALKRTK